MKCLDDNDLAWLTSDAPSVAERVPFTAHLDGCASCRALLADALNLEEGHDAPLALKAGDKVGRYLVLETLGAGAMGVVYAAYDPQLGRKIALKVLHADPVREAGREEGNARLMQEAQALARLAHPHVVTVHDVGLSAAGVFLAMEFLEGGTLREWLATPRSWRAVVSLVVHVGEGLVAAHEAHLIHRDLKPDNVVVDARGRPRLTDFGLAHASEQSAPDALENLAVDALTATGALVGTPAYMAPEQLRGEPAGELTDQFSFCAMLFEALSGRRPFEGKTVSELRVASAVPLNVPPGLPGWLQQVVRRGLSADPSARFPSMKQLVEALHRGLARRPLQRWAAVIAGGVLAGALGFASTRTTAACSGGPEAWGSAWDDARDAALIESAFTKTGVADASGRAKETSRLLSDAKRRWLSTWTQVCAATHERGEQSAALMDVRLACLADRRNELSALSRELISGPALVEQAVSAVLSLPSIERCAEVRAGVDTAQADPALVSSLSATLGRISVLVYLSKRDEAAALIPPALERARGAGLGASAGRLLFYQGKIAFQRGDYGASEKLLHESAATAEEAHDDATAADAWTQLIPVTGSALGRPAEARRWGRYADAALRRAGGDVEREAMRLRQLGLIASRIEGNLEEGLELAQRARRTFDALAQDERRDFHRLICDEVISGIAFDLGRVDEALAIHRDIAAIQEKLWGPHHAGLAVARVNVGEDLATLGRAEEALPWLQGALASIIENGAPQGYWRHRLAFGYRQRGDFAHALEEDRKALEALKLEGVSAYWRSWAQYGEGLDLLGLQRPKEAAALLEEAVQARRHEGPPVDLADARAALGRALWALEDRAAAREQTTQALALIEPLVARSQAPAFTRRQAELEAWLRAHAPSP